MNEPIVIAGIIAFSGTIISVITSVIVAVIGVRNVQIGASDEISNAAVVLVEPLKRALEGANAKIIALENRLAVIEGEHAREIKRHTDEIAKLESEYIILEEKHNRVIVDMRVLREENKKIETKYKTMKNDYQKVVECNEKLLIRVRFLESKLGTDELKEI